MSDVTAPEPAADPGRRRRALPRSSRVTAVAAVTALCWLLLDQATKILAVRVLSTRTIDLGALDLRLVHNPGGAFGFPGFPGLFVVVTVIVVVVVVRALPRTDRLSLATAYGLLLGGALGNGLDRVFRPPYFPSGHVVDFLDLGWWPVFNLADVGIVTGALLVTLIMLAVDREERAEARAAAGRSSVRPETGTPRR